MVSPGLSVTARRAGRAAARAAALTLLAAACRRDAAPATTAEPGSVSARVAETVRAKYVAPDVEAAGAWAWMARDSTWFVLVDAQSAVQGIVQGRAELWMANEQVAELFGRSEVLPSAAEIGAYAFDDLTGDGVPDLFGYVADSSGVSYPVFFAGARPGMTEEVAIAAAGWRFSTDEEHQPQTAGDGGRICALQMWAEAPLPDGGAEGWRWMAILRDGRLTPPMAAAPSCNAPPAGLQPDSARP